MSDLIERQDAIDAFRKELATGEQRGKYVTISSAITYLGAKRILKELPSAQPERKKGEWIWCGNHHICSECDEWALTRWDEDKCDEVDILTDFCPNCGARMKEGDVE